jgi:hypothetical protein
MLYLQKVSKYSAPDGVAWGFFGSTAWKLEMDNRTCESQDCHTKGVIQSRGWKALLWRHWNCRIRFHKSNRSKLNIPVAAFCPGDWGTAECDTVPSGWELFSDEALCLGSEFKQSGPGLTKLTWALAECLTQSSEKKNMKRKIKKLE